MATKFGKELQKLRIDHDINRERLAKSIGMKSSDLANIEHGKAEMPPVAFQKLIKLYAGEKKCYIRQLNESIRDSISEITFDMTKLSSGHRQSVIDLRSAIAHDIELEAEAARAKAKAAREAKAKEKEREEKRAKWEAEKKAKKYADEADTTEDEREQMSAVEPDEHEVALEEDEKREVLEDAESAALEKELGEAA